MTHLSGTDRSQLLLLPEAIDDYFGPNNPVRLIEAFGDGLGLQAAGFARVHAKAMGRQGFDPADLLKLYIYGYLSRVRSTLRLEVEARRNIEVIWVLRHLRPYFKTIADVRRNNQSAFRQVFREAVLLCRQFDLFAASCSPWTARGSRPSTARIATSLALPGPRSSAMLTRGWQNTWRISTRRMLTERQAEETPVATTRLLRLGRASEQGRP